MDSRAPPAFVRYHTPDLEALARVRAVVSSSGLGVESVDMETGVILTKWWDYESDHTVMPSYQRQNRGGAGRLRNTTVDFRRIRFRFHVGANRCVVVPEAERSNTSNVGIWRSTELSYDERRFYKEVLVRLQGALASEPSPRLD